jgi:hypothetical protein
MDNPADSGGKYLRIIIVAGSTVVLAMWLTWFFVPSIWTESSFVSGNASAAEYDGLVGGLAALIILFGIYVWTRSHSDPPLLVLTGLALLAAALIVVFASAYFYFGSSANFTTESAVHHGAGRLTHIDALSLAVGTLTTAGSTVSPRSQWARGVVMAQQLVDFAFIGFIATVAISRFRQPARTREG